MRITSCFVSFILLLLAAFPQTSGSTAADAATVTVQWDQAIRISKTYPSLLVMATNPLLRRGSRIHNQAWEALRGLEADYVSHLGWHPYPKLAVAELEPPEDGKTSWDFSLIDPVTIDFLEATKGHPSIINFSTIPQWMFKTEKPVSYPDDPNQVFWGYPQGTELRDPTHKELAEYYSRLASWYTRGGFTDEYGKWHESGHHFKIDYWGVLNEVDIEHFMTPEQYTACYDAIVEAVREVAPAMRFVGPFVAITTKRPDYFEYFLNPKNHKPGIPLDMLGYHFYALPGGDQSFEIQQYTVFEQVDKFLDVVRYIESIRKRFSPQTRTAVNEMGIILPDDFRQGLPDYVYQPTPDAYRNLFAAVYAYAYAELARIGIDVVAESQLVGHPSQFPSVTMVDWDSGRLNATYWVLKLVRDHMGPGDKLVQTMVVTPLQSPFLPSSVYAAGFVSQRGERKILLVNKRDRKFEISIPGVTGARVDVVDQTTGHNPPTTSRVNGDTFTLGGLAVAVVTFEK